MKKRGFAAGRWNGVGGKPKNREDIDQTAIRETQEEIGVTPLFLRQVAKLDFYHPNPEWNQQVVVFTTGKWKGEPIETEEMTPKWFGFDRIPYDQMWADDVLWMPLVLAGKKVRGEFTFAEENKLKKHKVLEVDDL